MVEDIKKTGFHELQLFYNIKIYLSKYKNKAIKKLSKRWGREI